MQMYFKSHDVCPIHYTSSRKYQKLKAAVIQTQEAQLVLGRMLKTNRSRVSICRLAKRRCVQGYIYIVALALYLYSK